MHPASSLLSSPSQRDREVCVSTRERDALDRLILRKSQHAFDPTHMLSSRKEHLPNKLVLLSLSKKNVSGWHGEWRLWKVDFNTWVLRGVLFKKFAIFSFSSFSPLFYLSEMLSGQNMSIPELFELLKMTPSTRPDNYVKPQYRQQWKLMTWQSIDRTYLLSLEVPRMLSLVNMLCKLRALKGFKTYVM